MLKLSAARLLLPDDSDAAPLLSEVRTDLGILVADVRRLAYDLRPPILDHLGLVSAIREHAERSAGQTPEQQRLLIRVEAPETLPLLPAAVEVAAYRIAQEALTNVERHARAATCVVALAIESLGASQALRLEVSDDGVGLPIGWRPGVGVSAMQERAAELGGECAVAANEPRGTRVVARLPIVADLP